MCRQNHGFGVDYFALGVIAYEFMLGRVNFIFQPKKTPPPPPNIEKKKKN